jgi:D-tyrosyl-tRNA(Tyr) deacylase
LQLVYYLFGYQIVAYVFGINHDTTEWASCNMLWVFMRFKESFQAGLAEGVPIFHKKYPHNSLRGKSKISKQMGHFNLDEILALRNNRLSLASLINKMSLWACFTYPFSSHMYMLVTIRVDLSYKVATMKIIVQRVFEGWVKVQGVDISRIGKGILVYVGLTQGDNKDVVQHMVGKTLGMRLWRSQEGKAWDKSVVDVGGEVLAVSQFTLYSVMKGNRPDFHAALQAEEAR